MNSRHRIATRRTTSTLALAAASVVWISPAVAQVVPAVRPGSAQCPVTVRTATCTGVLTPGVVVVETDQVDRLIVRDLTVPIAPPAERSGISFTRTAGDIGITTAGGLNGITVLRNADGIVARTVGGRIAIDNALDITVVNPFVQARTPNGAGIRAVIGQGTASTPRSAVAITNSGTIRVDTATSSVIANNAAISAFVSAPTDLKIVNTGALFSNVTAIDLQLYRPPQGMNAEGSAVEIINDGALTLTGDTSGGINVRADAATRSMSIVNRGNISGIGEEGIFIDGWISNPLTGFVLENTGNITLSDPAATSSRKDGIVVNISSITPGTSTLSNFGDIELSTRRVTPTGDNKPVLFGIRFTSRGDRLIFNNAGRIRSEQTGQNIIVNGASFDFTNSGKITRDNIDEDTSFAGSGSSAAGIVAIVENAVHNAQRIVVGGQQNYFRNDGAITLLRSNQDGKGSLIGIVVVVGDTTSIVNNGTINVNSVFGTGLQVSSLTKAEIANNTDIIVSGRNSVGVYLEDLTVRSDADLLALTFDRARDLQSTMILANSGAISATGINSDAIFVAEENVLSRIPKLATLGFDEALDLDDPNLVGVSYNGICDDFQPGGNSDQFLCGPGGTIFRAEHNPTTTITNTGLIAGGSGTGTGVRFTSTGTNILDNSGTITALSGTAVIGGVGREVIRNRGTIDGAVTLGAGDDSFALFASGSIGRVDGGAGTDVFAFDGAAGEAGTFTLTAGQLTGFERFVKQGAGAWTLRGTADAALPATIEVLGGTLAVEGNLLSREASVAAGATLAGTGRLGATSVADGGVLSPGGDVVGTLSLGSLALSAGSLLRFDLGRPDVVGGADNDLIAVAGNLTLDGTLNVVAQPSFGDGVYRLINYGGALTDNGLAIGTLASGSTAQVQTVIGGQVNLVVGSAMQFWDGTDTVADLTVDGGTGTWNNATTNWTRRAGDVNESWGSGFAVFQGAPGTVTIASGGVGASGLQFAVNGYRVEGGPLTLNAPATVRVGDGSAGSAGYVATIASAISGTGGVTKTDLGALALTGINTYTGGTNVNGGMLSVGADTALGTGGLTLNSGTLRTSAGFTSARGVAVTTLGGTIDTTGTLALSGALTGSGALTKAGAGTLTLTGDAAGFTGSTAVAAGTLDLRTALGGTLAVRSGGTLAGTGSAGATTVSGTIAPGSDGVGTLTLASLALTDSARLAFGLGAPGVVGGTTNDLIRVTGNLTLDGTLDVTALPGFGEGVYRLFDYGGTLTDNGLALGSIPGAGQVQTILPNQVNLVVGSALQYWDGASTVADLRVAGGSGTWSNSTTNWTRVGGDVNEIWGRGFAVFQSAPGVVTIAPEGVAATGLQFAVDGYRVEGGPLTLDAPASVRVGDGSAGGAGYTATIASSIGGTGGLFKTDLGTLILTGTNGYTGGTSVNGGVLQVASDANLGAASGGVFLNGGTLRASGALTNARGFAIGAGGGTLDTGANTVTLSGALAGMSALVKIGSGTLAYSGTGTLTGATRINAGILALTGTLAGPLSIASGATLTGTGRAASIDLGGIVAPGAATAMGTLNITGNALFQAGSTYRVDLAGNGGTDRIQVGGAATIQGGSVVINQLDARSAYSDGAVYRILDATGGRAGTFAGVTRNALLFGFTLGYDPTGAFVTARQITTTYNQGQAAIGLEALDRTTGTDSAGVFAALLALDSDPLRAALDASSGEIYSGLVADVLGSGTARADRLAARAYAAVGEGWGMWGGLDGRTGKIDGDGNAARLEGSGYGFDLGMDYRGAGNAWAAGIGGGYVHGSLDLDDRASRARSNGWQLGGYARYGTGGTGPSATLAATYSHADADVTRRIVFAGIDRTASGNADVTGTAVTGELRYGVAAGGGWSLGPVASVHYAHALIDDIREHGPASLVLSGRGDGEDRTRYGGGAFVNWQGGRGAIDASARYLGGGDTTANTTLAFAGSAGTAFDIRSPRIRGDAAMLNVAARYDLGGRWSIAGETRATISRDQRSVSANATLGWQF